VVTERAWAVVGVVMVVGSGSVLVDFGDFGVSFAATVAGRYTRWGVRTNDFLVF